MARADHRAAGHPGVLRVVESQPGSASWSLNAKERRSRMANLLKCKPLDMLMKEASHEDEHSLKRFTHAGNQWVPNILVQYQGRWELLTTMAPILKQNGVDASTLPQVTGVFNIVAFLVICLITFILVIGIQESANFNSAIVIIKVTIVLIFISIAGAFVLRHPAVAAANW